MHFKIIIFTSSLRYMLNKNLTSEVSAVAHNINRLCLKAEDTCKNSMSSSSGIHAGGQ